MKSRMEVLREMLEQEPHDAFLNYALALELEKENKIPGAIVILEKIVERDKNYLGAYYKLGKLYETASEKEKAAAAYRKGIKIAGMLKNMKTLNELSEALAMLEE